MSWILGAALMVPSLAAQEPVDDPDVLIGDLLHVALLSPTQADARIAAMRPHFHRSFYTCVHDTRVRISQMEQMFDERCAMQDALTDRLSCKEQNPIRGAEFVFTDFEITAHGTVRWIETTTGRAALIMWKAQDEELKSFDRNAYPHLRTTFGAVVADSVRDQFVTRNTGPITQWVSRLRSFVACNR